MLKKTVEFEDFDGNKVSEDLYFNFTKSELAEMELGTSGGLATKLQAIVATGAPDLIITAFTDVIMDAHGVRGADGRSFTKNAETRAAFKSSLAFDAIFMQLVTDATFAVEFIKGIMPADLQEEATKQLELPSAEDVLPPVVKDPKDMTHEELLAAFRAKNDSRK